MSSLLELQRKMAAAIMQPLTSDDGMRRRSGDGRRMRKLAAEFIKPNRRLSSFERLEIYNRQYWFRILDNLAEDFPGLRAVIGVKSFDRLAKAYLTECPSQSFTLRDLGSRLVWWLERNPAYLEPGEGADGGGRRSRLQAGEGKPGVRGADSRLVKMAFDVVRLEWAHIEAFDAAELKPLTPEEAAGLNGGSKLRPQPCIRLLPLRFPVDDMLLALKRCDADIAAQDAKRRADWIRQFQQPQRILLAVHRADHSVHYKRLEAGEFRLLQALQRGLPIGEAIEAAHAANRKSAAQYAEQAREWFATWARLGWLCPFVPQEPAPAKKRKQP